MTDLEFKALAAQGYTRVPVIAEARILKLGKRLAYGDVLLFSEGDPDAVAHVTGTYSIPPMR